MQVVKPEIIAGNERWVAVNKPSGLLSIPDRHQHDLDTVKGWLEKKYGQVWVVHRIDKDTSGLILYALNEETHRYLSQLFENRLVQKTYLGIVQGTPNPPAGTVNAPIAENQARKGTMIVHARGKASITHYQVVQACGPYSLVQFEIETGRTHQIRVHAQHLGHPIAADPVYSKETAVFLSGFRKNMKKGHQDWEEKPLLARLGLHAASLRFTDEDGSAIHLEAPLFRDMKALLQQLGKTTR